VYNLNYHIIWRTKYRRKVLADSVGDDLETILHAIAKEHGYRIPHVEIGLDDHIHLFVSAPPKISVSIIYGFSARMYGLRSAKNKAARVRQVLSDDN
jgi:putative transposase